MDPAPKTPAARILDRFGVGRISAWTGRHRSRVHRWPLPSERGGTGGVVPHQVRAKIIEGARLELGETLTFAEFEPQDGESYLVGIAA